MKLEISGLYAIAYINGLSGKINICSKLCTSREEAQETIDILQLGKDAVINPVFINANDKEKLI